MEPAYC